MSARGRVRRAVFAAMAVLAALALGARWQARRGIGPVANFPRAPYSGYYRVTEVYDGDTIFCAGLGRVRLIGIDTPERDEPGFAQATEHTRKRVLGKVVRLDICPLTPRDRYGRWRALVYVKAEGGKEIMLNKELADLGLARIANFQPCHVDARTWRLRRVIPTPGPQDTVYVTPHGKRYHRAGCTALRGKATPLSRAEAEEKGYTPCRRCWPEGQR